MFIEKSPYPIKTNQTIYNEKEDENKNEFMEVISHEMRNPLATITSGVKLLKLTNENERNSNIIKILEDQAEYLTKLVDDLLDITMISQKKTILKKETVNFNKLLIDSIEEIKPQFREKGIKLLEDICSEPITVNVDPLSIAKCVGNILKNALKFSEQNGTVNISLKTEGENAVINVKDDGIGISQEKLTTIFEPFKQERNYHTSYNNMGLGLGLSIVKEYIEMHGGSVSASSPGVGKGSTFTVRLPKLI